ncbi:unnamed protein product [Coffea canephora]|uniref:DH200=94 genomic scaffold, scaffold_840 n=1 Tax=Coffea canephora TaxID=49390 RepID=A0A068VGS1_COFCA|nr:unnamed protein product [Coffea canephora]
MGSNILVVGLLKVTWYTKGSPITLPSPAKLGDLISVFISRYRLL